MDHKRANRIPKVNKSDLPQLDLGRLTFPNPRKTVGSNMHLEIGISILNSVFQPLESGWVVHGPENGYKFPYPRLLRVKRRGLGKLYPFSGP